MLDYNIIPFNKPYLAGDELHHIEQSVKNGHISGNGVYTKMCHEFFERRYDIPKILLTTSCTDALEMAAILLDIKNGDEVIVPSFTFVSTANAFVLRGAQIVFVDSQHDHPNIDCDQIESLITDRTKAIVPVHYAGCACDMDRIMYLAAKYNLSVVEDAAQGIETRYKGKNLGSIGHLAAFSFHETKNIIAGEGGMLAINDAKFLKRAEIIWEKGTNRSAFFRGEINRYGWVDTGSSFLPSDIIAAYLWGQLEKITDIQSRRLCQWYCYYKILLASAKKNFRLPVVPKDSTNNAHMFYLVCKDGVARESLRNYLIQKRIYATTHYVSLYSSEYFKEEYKGNALHNSDHFTQCLLRLPLYFELELEQIKFICECIVNWDKEYVL